MFTCYFRHLYSRKIYLRKIRECHLHPWIIHLSNWTLPTYAYDLATFVLFFCFSMPICSLTATVCVMTSCLCDNHQEGLVCNSKTVPFCLFAQQAYHCPTSEISDSMDYGSPPSSNCYPPPHNALQNSTLFVSIRRLQIRFTLQVTVKKTGERQIWWKENVYIMLKELEEI